jgi:hypothetical protein
MKVVVVCNRDDSIALEVLRDNDPLQTMDLMSTALTANKKLVIFQVDNSGVTEERQYPKAEESHAPPPRQDSEHSTPPSEPGGRRRGGSE